MASLSVICEAYREQWSATRMWCDLIDEQMSARPSVLPEWNVSDLVAHLGLVADSLAAVVLAGSASPRLSIAEYLSTYAAGAGAISERTRSQGSVGWPELLDGVDQAAEAANEALTAPDRPAEAVVLARRGPIRWSDFVTTRCIELSVHTDDLARSLPELAAPDVPGPCLKLAVRSLSAVLAERAPGRSVEVRVPPYAAVQVIAGPRHTRGTPGAVVEMAPLTMLRLAAGRVAWPDAMSEGMLRASGERTDLSAWFPLLA